MDLFLSLYFISDIELDLLQVQFNILYIDTGFQLISLSVLYLLLFENQLCNHCDQQAAAPQGSLLSWIKGPWHHSVIAALLYHCHIMLILSAYSTCRFAERLFLFLFSLFYFLCLTEFLCKECPRVHIHFDRVDIKEIPPEPVFFRRWLHERFEIKDR